MIVDNSPVRWGVLGCARVFERRMVPGFHATENAQLFAIASRKIEKAQEIAQKHGITRSYGSYEALLADREIEAVYIPLPNDLHAEWTLRALDAGKHVLCDKPAALSFSDAQRMAQNARASGLRLMEAFMYRHHPQHARVKELLAAGAIGEPTHFRGMFAYTAAPDPSNIRWNPSQGGGAFLDVSVYPLNAARFLFDAEPLFVSAVCIIDPMTDVDIMTSALLDFGEGRMATVTGGFNQAFVSRYEIAGRGGSLTAERAFQVGEAGVTLTLRSHDTDVPVIETLPHSDQYQLEIEHFSRCVRDASLPLLPGEDGEAQARIVEAVLRSAREKRHVEIAEIA